jgi:hypothetical protein
MKLALVHTFLLCGVLLGQISRTEDSDSLKRVMTITVNAWLPSDRSTVRVTKIALPYVPLYEKTALVAIAFSCKGTLTPSRTIRT